MSLASRKEGEGAADALLALGRGGDTKAMQQKVRRDIQRPIYLKQPDAIIAIYV
jgi:hypothetical protein